MEKVFLLFLSFWNQIFRNNFALNWQVQKPTENLKWQKWNQQEAMIPSSLIYIPSLCTRGCHLHVFCMVTDRLKQKWSLVLCKSKILQDWRWMAGDKAFFYSPCTPLSLPMVFVGAGLKSWRVHRGAGSWEAEMCWATLWVAPPDLLQLPLCCFPCSLALWAVLKVLLCCSPVKCPEMLNCCPIPEVQGREVLVLSIATLNR